jgi:hypothetical protein
MDSAGNTLVCGYFTGTAEFGANVLSGFGLGDVFIAKVNRIGAVQWALGAGGAGFDEARAVATDSSGNVYVTGNFQGEARFGDKRIASKGGSDCFVAKLNADGRVVWVNRAGAAGNDLGSAIAILPDGGVVVAGTTAEDELVEGFTTIEFGGDDAFVIRYDSEGGPVWVRTFGGPMTEAARGVATDAAGRIVLTGYFAGASRFGETQIESSGQYDLFLCSLTGAGNVRWVRSAGGLEGDYGHAVAARADGEICVAGMFSTEADFEGSALVSHGATDVCIASYGPEGEFRWARRAGGESSEEARAVTYHGNGAGDGQWLMTGQFFGRAQFGTTELFSDGHSDVFLARLSPMGNWISALPLGSTSYAAGNGLGVDSDGAAAVSGYYRAQTTMFGMPLPNAGAGRNLFLTRIKFAPAVLQIGRVGTDVVVRWPAGLDGLYLETTPGLSTPWEYGRGTTVMEADGSRSYRQRSSGTGRLFRLRGN